MYNGLKNIRDISFVVFDFDGVFTNNKVYVSQNGIESVRCCRSDGLGLRRLDEVGVDCMILSTETNPIVAVRAEKLKIACRHGLEDKLAVLDEEREKRGLAWEQIAYLGNDINDADCLRAVGLPVVVADAFDEIIPLAKLFLKRNGGEGAVRELCDMIWHARIGHEEYLNERG